MPIRCWPTDDPVYIAYHDEEWGRPIRDERGLYERLCLEGFQAGLSWITILRKRDNFQKAFKHFDAQKVARFGKADVRRLLRDAGIIRNRLKIAGAVANARRFLEVQKEFGSFDRYIWRFTGNRTMRDPNGVTRKTLRATSPESDALSKDLKQRGFTFVGSTVCYAHMQATGMVDDHVKGCFKYRKR